MANLGVRQRESEFRGWISRQFKTAGWFYQGIETTTKAGVPDLYAVASHKNKAAAFWLELKTGDTTAPFIRKEQRIWGLHHAKAGGLSYYLYYCWATGCLLIYDNPIKEVRVSGNYLVLIDTPIRIFNREELIEVLTGILFYK